MDTYPELDGDISGYTVVVMFDADGAEARLPGRHIDYAAAAARALKCAKALRDAGETGCRAKVSYSGERPAGFPKNGVVL